MASIQFVCPFCLDVEELKAADYFNLVGEVTAHVMAHTVREHFDLLSELHETKGHDIAVWNGVLYHHRHPALKARGMN